MTLRYPDTPCSLVAQKYGIRVTRTSEGKEKESLVGIGSDGKAGYRL